MIILFFLLLVTIKFKFFVLCHQFLYSSVKEIHFWFFRNSLDPFVETVTRSGLYGGSEMFSSKIIINIWKIESTVLRQTIPLAATKCFIVYNIVTRQQLKILQQYQLTFYRQGTKRLLYPENVLRMMRVALGSSFVLTDQNNFRLIMGNNQFFTAVYELHFCSLPQPLFLSLGPFFCTPAKHP